MIISNKPEPCKALLKDDYGVSDAEKIVFTGVDGYDVYNISCPFSCAGVEYIAGRVEKRDDELSCVKFFKKIAENTYEVCFEEKTFNLFQDPFVTFIGGELVLGGVQIHCDPINPKRILSWRTLFYKGTSPQDLQLFAIGPDRMKDIRLVGMEDGKVGIFSRPQGSLGGLGKIGFALVDTLDQVNDEAILSAQVFNTHFIAEEWGGANDLHLLNDGKIGVIGHIACRTQDKMLHYYPMSFIFDYKTMTHSPIKILATRANLPSGKSKRPDLTDVLFTAGVRFNGDNTARLYTGMSDCEAGVAIIPNPFT